MNQAGALINVYTDGTILLNHGGTEMGQGLHTKVAQVVAEELQVDIGKLVSAQVSGVEKKSLGIIQRFVAILPGGF